MEAIHSELRTFDVAGSIGASALEGCATRRTGAPLPRDHWKYDQVDFPNNVERFAHATRFVAPACGELTHPVDQPVP